MKPRRKTFLSTTGKQGTCIDCRHALLIQYGEDPVLADCSLTESRPRQVARYGSCTDYEATPQQKIIDKKEKLQWFEKL